MRELAAAIARAASVVPLVVVHGGGREIDAALTRAGIEKRQVDGLRVTDAATLGVVVEVLAGAINTRFVAAINAAGGRAVGLTGADAGLAVVDAAPPTREHRWGGHRSRLRRTAHRETLAAPAARSRAPAATCRSSRASARAARARSTT